MGDLISRQAVLAIVMDSCLDLDKWDDTDQFCKEIEELPSVENKGFLNFLYQIIPPNEMEKYIEMYKCKNDKNNC